jgi:tripartite ATP-independent transporter DctP family solute receptor
MKFVSKYSFLFLALWLSCLWGCNTGPANKTLFLAHGLPTSHPVHKGMLDFQQRLAEKSQGTLTVKIFADGQLGSEREVLELLQIGSIAMTKVSAAAMANFAPSYQILGVPYLFRDKDHFFNALEGEVGKKLLQSGSEYWLRGLCFYDAGSRSFYTKDKPIRSPEDLKGLKIRVMNHQMSVDMVNAMGGSATPMAYGELYTALQQGVVDGAENNPPSLLTSRHYEVCKYYTLDEHSSIPDVMVIGTKFWNRLSPQEQQWVQEAASESVSAQRAFWAASEAESLKIMKEAGVEIIRTDKSLFSDKCRPVLSKFIKKPGMEELVKAIQNQ